VDNAVDKASRHRQVPTWYAEASPVEQHFCDALLVASLVVFVLTAIALVVFAVSRVSAGGAL
jgi:hypothetical protein